MKKLKLLKHQVEALKQSKGRKTVAFYSAMGMGKTFMAGEKMKELGKKLNVVVCQKSKVDDWIQHFRDYYPKLKIYNGTVKGFDYDIDVHLFSQDTGIIVINYDLIFRREYLKNLEDFTLVLDESSIIQNPSAKRTAAVLKLKPSAVILLSGTPTAGKYENLWSQARLLGWKISLEAYNNNYINWVKLDDVPVSVVDKNDPYKNVDRLKQKFREHGAIFQTLEDGIELPEQNFVKVFVPKSLKYKQFLKHKVATINDKDVLGDTTFSLRLFLRYFAGYLSKEKLQAFKDLLDSTEERFIVFYNFNAELDELLKLCEGWEISIINGKTKDLTAYENSEKSVTFVQYQAGAMGLNLQKANRMIYFTLPEKSDLFEQSKARIHRIGQSKPCFYYLMIVKGSIEESILKTLEMRKDFTDELFREGEK